MTGMTAVSPDDNQLLAALPVRERNAAHRVSKRFPLAFGEVVAAAHERSEFALFPIRGVVSMVQRMKSGARVEAGLIGREGVVGLDTFTEGLSQTSEAIVQCEGTAWQIGGDDVLLLFRRHREMQRQILRFTHAFVMQISQTAACNRVHPVEARLARWLLMMEDRVLASQIRITQQVLSHMLGARTASVNEAVQKLEAAGTIAHRRQEITIRDREGLELRSCECYGIVCRIYDALAQSALAPQPS